jgi:UDP-N-acetylmuramoyl-tripeptide--D-alanyl-D-alanine ligase
MKLSLGKIADWIHADGEFDTSAEALGYAIDSRTVGAGELFFAVRGERLDGHDFVQAALANGAVAAVISNRWVVPAEVDPALLLLVADGEDCVLRAMQQLARAVRRDWGGRVIGVTGSAGKTTTKEAVAEVLGTRFKVLKSAGNLNNAFGLPLQLLKLEAEHEVAVIEMGMNHAGEIAALAKIAEPDWAVVSNVGPVHLEFFSDGIEGIARAKYELVEALPVDGVALLNFDDPFVAGFGRGMGERAIFYGLGEGADVRAVHVADAGLEGVVFTVEVKGARASVQLKMLGRHNVPNALAAIAVGLQSGMTLEECAEAVGRLRAGDKRGEVLSWRGAMLINDCYNSNPKALDAMVEALMAIPAERHIVIAGEMRELGPEAEVLHAACGSRMAGAGVDLVVGVGGAAEALVEAVRAEGVEAKFVQDAEEAGRWLAEHAQAGDAVLLKASRGVRLEKALTIIAEKPVTLSEDAASYENYGKRDRA